MQGIRWSLRIASVLLIALGCAANSRAVDFAPPKTYPVGTSPSAVVVGDFNGDGKADLAVANSGSANMSILLGNGDGTFKDAVNSSAGPSPHALAAGDFNGDHKLDLIVISPGDTTNGIQGQANLLLGNGDGTFQPPAQIQAGQFPLSMAVGDLNGDKKVDLIIGDRSDESLSVLLGNGDGTFQLAKVISLGSSGAVDAIVVADFNRDTNPDVVAATPAGEVILVGHGDGTFQTPNHVANSTSGGFLSAGDFDNDHKVDLVGLTRIPPPPSCHEFCISTFRVTMYRGNGDGTFNVGVLVGPGFLSHSNIIAADFNADNKLDLFMTKGVFGNLQLGAGNGGSFIEVPPIDSGAGTIRTLATLIASGDFNGDKLPDLVLANGLNNSVTILLNTSPISGADLALTLNPTQANAVVGVDLSYNVAVFSEGPQDASGVILTEDLPSGLKLVSAQPSQGTCTGTTTITCNLGAMADPSAATAQFTVTPTAEGTLTDAVQVAATQLDLNSKNNSGSITVTAVLPADLSVSATASQTTATVGDKVTVSANVSNSGPATATNVSLTDSFPDNLPVSSLSISQGACTTAPGNITCAIGTLMTGGNVTLSYVITAQAAGVLANNLHVASDTPEVFSANNDAFVTVTVNPPPDFSLSAAATNLTVKRGGQVSEVLTFGAQGGFSGTIALACSVTGPAPMPTCGISPSSVTPGNTATLTINAGALSAQLAPESFGRACGLFAAWLPLGLMGCVLATGIDKKRRRKWALCLLMLAATILPVACGGGSSSGPPPPPAQNYTVTVTATSGSIQHSTTVAVTVR